MSIFKKKLNFKWYYFEFNECNNFTIRKNVNNNYSIGEHILLVSNSGLTRDIKAKITNIQHIRYCDIDNFKCWHLNGKKWDKDSDLYDPKDIMQKIYGKNFNEKEIVTLIWFKITE